jgi:hypothetical protein
MLISNVETFFATVRTLGFTTISMMITQKTDLPCNVNHKSVKFYCTGPHTNKLE